MLDCQSTPVPPNQCRYPGEFPLSKGENIYFDCILLPLSTQSAIHTIYLSAHVKIDYTSCIPQLIVSTDGRFDHRAGSASQCTSATEPTAHDFPPRRQRVDREMLVDLSSSNPRRIVAGQLGSSVGCGSPFLPGECSTCLVEIVVYVVGIIPVDLPPPPSWRVQLFDSWVQSVETQRALGEANATPTCAARCQVFGAAVPTSLVAQL